MKGMFDSIKGKKKRNTVGAADAVALREELEEEGKNSASPGPQRLSPNSPAVNRPASHQGSSTNSPATGRAADKGKFATMMGKAKEKMAAALTPTMSRPTYIEDDPARNPEDDMPAPTINLSHYGAPAGDGGGDDDDDDEPAAAAPVAKSPAPPVEEPYVEDDPTKTVNRIVKAIFDYDAQEASEMTMKQGDRIAVYSFEQDRWGQGRNLRTMQRGEFPCNRTNINEVPPLEQKPKHVALSAPGLQGGAVASPQVQRIKVDPGTPVVGSPQVQRLSFFDHLNQDIAYRNAQAKGPQEVVYYETVNVPVQQGRPPSQQGQTTPQQGPPKISVSTDSGLQASPSHPVVSPGRQSQGQVSPGRQSHGHPVNPAVAAIANEERGHHSAPLPNAAGGSGRRPLPPGPSAHASGTASPVVGSPQVQRLSFFEHLNKDIQQQERKKQQKPVAGPVITRIVASEEEYALDERGTE